MTPEPWNYDLTQAPTDGTPIWAACANGEVLRTHWLPPTGKLRPVGRWTGLGSTQQPIAFMIYRKPTHPYQMAAPTA